MSVAQGEGRALGGAVVEAVPEVAQAANRPQWRGLCTFIIGLLFALLLLAVVIPGRACACGSPEYRAIGILRAINSAQSTFAAACGGDGYAQVLEDLAKTPPESTAGFIAADISPNGVVVDGYVFTVRAGPEAHTVTDASQTCNSAKGDAVSHYFAEAHPVRVGETGQRSFATDDRGIIYVNNTGQPLTPDMAGGSELQ
jgi:hypothetical protein